VLTPQVVGQNADTISPIAVDAVLRVIDPLTAINCDLRDIKVHRNTNTDVNECHMHHANNAAYIYIYIYNASVRHYAALAISSTSSTALREIAQASLPIQISRCPAKLNN
jgi:hypothetical protein